MSKTTILKTCMALKLKDKDAEYFENLVFFNQAKTIKEKNLNFDKLTRLLGNYDKLIPEDYDPRHPDAASIRRALSDDTGGFAFEKVDTTRTYNLIAGDAPARKWAIASGVRADSGIAFFPGTDILAHCDGVTASKVDSVPAGALRFIVESRAAGWQHDTTLAAAADTTKVSAGESKLILIP